MSSSLTPLFTAQFWFIHRAASPQFGELDSVWKAIKKLWNVLIFCQSSVLKKIPLPDSFYFSVSVLLVYIGFLPAL